MTIRELNVRKMLRNDAISEIRKQELKTVLRSILNTQFANEIRAIEKTI